MSDQKSRFVFFTLLLTFCAYALAETPMIVPFDHEVIEKPVRADLALEIGSDKPNEDFYKLPSFAVGKNGRIYILDSGNSRIQCFSKEGKFLFGFGRRGQGPGELSDSACKIKILPDGNIYVIDNSRRTINVYGLDGKFLFPAGMSAWYNDIVLLNGTYYLSNILLEENHRPIHASRSLGKIDSDFGIFVEPAPGILRQISVLPLPEPWRHYYSDCNFTKLVVTNKGELIFSQGYPYRLIKYDGKGKVLKDIMGDVDFDTYHHVKITADRESPLGRVIADPDWPCIVLDTSLKNDHQVVVPYLNPKNGVLYIDTYDLDLNLISRYRLLNLIADTQKGDYVFQSMVDDNNSLYALVISKEDYPKLFKYNLILN